MAAMNCLADTACMERRGGCRQGQRGAVSHESHEQEEFGDQSMHAGSEMLEAYQLTDAESNKGRARRNILQWFGERLRIGSSEAKGSRSWQGPLSQRWKLRHPKSALSRHQHVGTSVGEGDDQVHEDKHQVVVPA